MKKWIQGYRYAVETCYYVGGTVDNESALKSAETLLSRVRASLPAPPFSHDDDDDDDEAYDNATAAAAVDDDDEQSKA
ncbi:hypothetical protein PoB_004240100 [Plakobranchus ocellatus]|uniref:Uncharacterized protein n=1 Tax=Plakobranchus ocellatus TaxID=259542 RepID=A0AAV4AXQ3_9GAST|nr:hypothetical protein PoB_004240100 [Plakobranchus ocellatus]